MEPELQMAETRRKICHNLRENLESLKLNRRLPFFFKDRTTEYFGLVHAALFGPEPVGYEEAEKLLGNLETKSDHSVQTNLLGISRETVDQLIQYESERTDLEVSRWQI